MMIDLHRPIRVPPGETNVTFRAVACERRLLTAEAAQINPAEALTAKLQGAGFR